jgi:hypothetical protein
MTSATDQDAAMARPPVVQEAGESAFRPFFIMIPYEILKDKNLSHAAKLTYGRLKLFAGKNGRCCPKHKTLAREVCLSDRQLRNVLVELRNAGWIDWRRARTSCLYIVHSDRQETSGQGGKRLPINSEENCRSRLVGNCRTRVEGNCRQKKGSENHHRKEDLQKRDHTQEGEIAATAVTSSLAELVLSSSKTDDERPTLRTPKNAVFEFSARLTSRHGPQWDVERTIRICKEELDRYGVSFVDFAEWEPTKTSSPEKIRSDAYYRSIAREFGRTHGSLNSIDATFNQFERIRAGLAEQERGAPAEKCSACRNTGFTQCYPKVYCSCLMGIEVRRSDARIQAKSEWQAAEATNLDHKPEPDQLRKSISDEVRGPRNEQQTSNHRGLP